jgi:sugar phosphate isomerase/epimerase
MAALSINEMTTYRWSFEQDVANYRSAGISAIGVWRQKLADYGEAAGIKLLAGSGLAVSNLLWAGGFTGSDGRNFAESLADAADAIRLAHAMRSRCLVVYSGGRNGHTQNHARRLFVAALQELLPLASEFDVTLAIEPMHPACAGEWTFLTSAEDGLNLLDAVGSPRLQLAFDTYHLGYDPNVFSHIQQLAGRIAVVHLGDGHQRPDRDQNRTRLGCGSLPLREIVAALHDSGFDGYYDVELIGEEIETCGCYKQLLEDTKQAFEELVSVAR